jgi:hypothetical protein
MSLPDRQSLSSGGVGEGGGEIGLGLFPFGSFLRDYQDVQEGAKVPVGWPSFCSDLTWDMRERRRVEPLLQRVKCRGVPTMAPGNGWKSALWLWKKHLARVRGYHVSHLLILFLLTSSAAAPSLSPSLFICNTRVALLSSRVVVRLKAHAVYKILGAWRPVSTLSVWLFETKGINEFFPSKEQCG